jgi:hypothetical protein
LYMIRSMIMILVIAINLEPKKTNLNHLKPFHLVEMENYLQLQVMIQ